MSKFNIGDEVEFKIHQAYSPFKMTVGKIDPDSLYCECFYFTEGKSLQVGEFHDDLLKLAGEDEEDSDRPFITTL